MKTLSPFVSGSLALYLFLCAPSARAQIVAAPATPAVVAAPASAVAPGVADDPNIDRGFLLPTAMTQPAGSVTYNNYELLFHGLTYGITDRVQATVTVLAPIVEDMPLLGIAAVKGQIVSTSRFHLALQGSAGFGHELSSHQSADSAGMLGAGAFATACLSADCASLASAGATYQLIMPNGSARREQVILYGASIVGRVSPHVKLLGEISSLATTSYQNGSFDNVNGALVSYGVRFHTSNLAGDVGFVNPVVTAGTSEFVLGLPFINVSYRW